MKRILIALAFILAPSFAWAQCNGIFPNNTICGNISGQGNLPRPVPNSALTGVPGGLNGQVQYNNVGVFGGLTNVQLTTLIQQFSSSLSGVVPASGGGTSNFIRADGTWAIPALTPPGGSNGQVQINNSGAFGGITNTQLTALSSPTTYNVRDCGATGNGSTDDSAAFQTCVNKLSSSDAVRIPCGAYLLGSSVTFGNAGFRIFGDDVSCVNIIINSSSVTPFIVQNTGGIYLNVFRDITCFFNAQGSASSCLQFNGSTTGSFVSYSNISRVHCVGANACIRNARTVDATGEAQFDWNQISSIQTTNNGALATVYGIYFDNGSGTGNVYSNMNLVVSTGGIEFLGANGANVGDMTIANIQFGGGGTAMLAAAGATYHSRITVSNVQCDAGITTCLDMQSYDRNTYLGVVLGGGVTNSLGTPTNQYCGSLSC